MRGRPLEEIAAYQWEVTNRIALDDLRALPRERWITLSYADLLADPPGMVNRLCRFMGFEADAGLRERTAAALPLSRFTLTPPAEGKWRRDEDAIKRVLPGIEDTWRRLREMD